MFKSAAQCALQCDAKTESTKSSQFFFRKMDKKQKCNEKNNIQNKNAYK